MSKRDVGARRRACSSRHRAIGDRRTHTPARTTRPARAASRVRARRVATSAGDARASSARARASGSARTHVSAPRRARARYRAAYHPRATSTAKRSSFVVSSSPSWSRGHRRELRSRQGASTRAARLRSDRCARSQVHEPGPLSRTSFSTSRFSVARFANERVNARSCCFRISSS